MKLFIRELRQQKGMTQKELAEKMQVSFQTISKWENGVNLPDISHLPRLAEVFGVSSDMVLGIEPIEEKTELRQFDSNEYWNTKRNLVKIWKSLYWNDDYFAFLVRDVWKFKKPVDILDFGCGYGFWGQKFMPLLPEGSSYSGIDIDAKQLEEARSIFAGTPYACKFLQQDIYEYQPEKKYDLVVALYLMSYVRQPESLIEKMKASLRPGGMLLLVDSNLEVEQAGYFSGLEKQENGLKRPDFIPVWDYEVFHQERDYRMGTKLPFLMKKCGIKGIEARISDRVILYEPSDANKKETNHIFRDVYGHLDSYAGGANYFVSRGCSMADADKYIEYYQKTTEYFGREDAMAVKTAGIYFVYGTV